jgi:hypothetical protein
VLRVGVGAVVIGVTRARTTVFRVGTATGVGLLVVAGGVTLTFAERSLAGPGGGNGRSAGTDVLAEVTDSVAGVATE